MKKYSLPKQLVIPAIATILFFSSCATNPPVENTDEQSMVEESLISTSDSEDEEEEIITDEAIVEDVSVQVTKTSASKPECSMEKALKKNAQANINLKEEASLKTTNPVEVTKPATQEIASKETEVKKSIEGVVTYEQTYQIRSNLKGKQKMYALLVPKETKSKMNLFFNNSATRTVNIKDKEKSGGIQISIDAPEFITDFSNKRNIQLLSLGKNKYAVSNPAKDKSAKIRYFNDEKTILGYKCKRAVIPTTSNEGEMEVWYTEQIPVAGSPMEDFGINGFVLEVKTKSIFIKASNIKMQKVDEAIFSVPAEYKQITEDQYKNLKDEFASEQASN